MSAQDCVECGAKLPEGADLCPSCGMAVAKTAKKPAKKTAAAAKSEPKTAAAAAASTAETKPKKPGKVKAGVLALPGKTKTALVAMPGKTKTALVAMPGKTKTALVAMPGKTKAGLVAVPGKVKAGFFWVGSKVKAGFSWLGPKVMAGVHKVTGAWTSWWGKRTKGARLGIIIGGASAVVLVGVALFLYFFLRPVFVVAVETDDAVVAGDDVVLSVDVTNEGRTAGDCKLSALVDGEQLATEAVKVGAGEEEQVEVRLTGLAAGHYDVTLAGWPESVYEVWVMTPPEFEMGLLKMNPDPMDINAGKEAEVTVGVVNVGEATGSYDLELSLDGELIETRQIELKGGEYSNEDFAVTIAAPGSCEVSINEMRAEFPVYQLERPKNGTVLAKKKSSGYNRLRIINQDSMDCVVVLTKVGKTEPFLAVYVRAGGETTVRQVVSDTYDCYYSFGEDWCAYRNEFTTHQWCGRFDESMKFTTTKSGISGWGYTVRYTIFTLTLGSYSGEASSTSILKPDEFPEL